MFGDTVSPIEEIAEILALGFLRLNQVSDHFSLDFLPNQSTHAEPPLKPAALQAKDD